MSGLAKHDASALSVAQAVVMLAQCKTVVSAKVIHDKAKAVGDYYKRLKGDYRLVTQDAGEIVAHAARRIGELTSVLDRAAGSQRFIRTLPGAGPMPKRKSLEEFGLTVQQAHTFERAASLPESQFSTYVKAVRKAGEIPTTAGAVALAKLPENVRKETLAKLGDVPDVKKAIRAVHKELAEKDLAEQQAKISKAQRTKIESVCDLRVCSCEALFRSGIQPDAVITDPPYPAEFLPCFTELARAVKSVPCVAVMSGQSNLPEVYRRLCEHLKYLWTLAYLTPGGQAVQIHQAKVQTFWKPVLLFGKPGDKWIGDVAQSKPNDNDKRFHGWGQSESGMADLVDRLTQPGQLICDPFAGGGTTAVVALALGRRFIGCDIDKDCIKKARARVETMQCTK